MKRLVIRLLCYSVIQLLCYSVAYSQSVNEIFHRPMTLQPLLSGGFGELREAHFHSGIDFRTQGTIGHRVFACEDGFVSRVSVSPTGYGLAVYIAHPNGYTTLYGHLDSFNEKIGQYVKQEQYKLERFAVNLFPDSTLLPVRRGELIGLSGNTGSSNGPHLHFEVRDTKTQDPINPLKFGFGIRDNIPPTLVKLAVYPIGAGSTVNGSEDRIIFDLEKAGNNYRIAGDRRMDVIGNVAFAINTFDMTTGSNIRCGPYRIRFFVDTLLMFSQTMDRFSFDETRYVLSVVDYEYFINNRVRFNKLFIQPNNQLSVFDSHIDRGIVSFAGVGTRKASVVVSDFQGNTSRLNFDFSQTHGSPLLSSTTLGMLDPVSFTGIYEPMYKREFVHNEAGIKVVILPDALYDEIDFTSSVSQTIPDGLFSRVYRLHSRNVPLHKAMTIEIDAENLPERLRDKALVVNIGANGRRTNTGGAYSDGVVRATSRVFGEFAIGVDTVPPRITPVNIRNGANMRGVESIRFTITDNFSGISTYNGWINGQWALFEYDAKNNLLFYKFDPERLSRNSQHEIVLKVTDAKENTAEFRANFSW